MRVDEAIDLKTYLPYVQISKEDAEITDTAIKLGVQ